MRLEEKDLELDVFEMDWSSLSKRDRDDIVNKHIDYVILSRRQVESSGAYLANIRSLTMLLFFALVLALLKVDNRAIALSIIGLQFAKTLLSRLIEAYTLETSLLAKENLSSILLKKVKKPKNV